MGGEGSSGFEWAVTADGWVEDGWLDRRCSELSLARSAGRFLKDGQRLLKCRERAEGHASVEMDEISLRQAHGRAMDGIA